MAADCCEHCGAHAGLKDGLWTSVLRQCVPGHGVQWVCDDCHLRLTGMFFVGSTWHGETKAAAQCPRGHPGPITHPWAHGWLLCLACAAAAGVEPPAPVAPARAPTPRQLRLFEEVNP